MKKLFLITLLAIILNGSSTFAKDNVICGSISYTVETAKNAAFSGLDLKIDKKILKEHEKDTNNKENREALKNGTQPEGRTVMSFELKQGAMTVKGYAITYDEKPEYIYYYTTSGYLVAFDIDKPLSKTEYPYKIGKYNPITGNLISVALYISDDEQYIYLKNGRLKAHWVGDICYNAKGKPIAKRF